MLSFHEHLRGDEIIRILFMGPGWVVSFERQRKRERVSLLGYWKGCWGDMLCSAIQGSAGVRERCLPLFNTFVYSPVQ